MLPISKNVLDYAKQIFMHFKVASLNIELISS